jgi:hypothetical protein
MSGRQVDLLQERGISRVVFPIVLPALRERRSDISAPVRHFIKQFSHRMGKQAPSISLETMRGLPVVFLAWQHSRVAELGGTSGYSFAGRRAPKPVAQKANGGYAPHSTSFLCFFYDTF